MTLEPTPYLVSACLLGEKCRYDGKSKAHQGVKDFLLDKKHIPFCPEESVLGTPRPPCMIYGGKGKDVLLKTAKVKNNKGDNRSKEFIEGAENALMKIKKHGITKAIMKEKSPSCGVHLIYQGETGKIIKGEGVTSALLKQHKIDVISEEDL